MKIRQRLRLPTTFKIYIGFPADPWKKLEAVFRRSGNLSLQTRIEKSTKRQKRKTLLEKLIEADTQISRMMQNLVRVPYVRD